MNYIKKYTALQHHIMCGAYQLVKPHVSEAKSYFEVRDIINQFKIS